MKPTAGSALIVALGIAAAAQAAETGVTDPPPSGACLVAIVRLEKVLNEALGHRAALATAPESVGAMLHHQPSRDSVAEAQRKSIERMENALATARKLRSEGKRSECVSMLEKIALSVGVR